MVVVASHPSPDGESGYLAPTRSSEALASIIAEVLDDPANAVTIGTAGRAAAP